MGSPPAALAARTRHGPAPTGLLTWRAEVVAVNTREVLAAMLADVGRPGSFSASLTVPADDLHLEVRGLGPLTFPVTEEQARQLCTVARPARYGLREQTLLDRAVRHTWEIPRSRVRIDKRRWNRTLVPVVARLREGLGLPDGCTLEAELHSMLVYAPGHFFLPHQDSEKEDGMVASLVVTLPSVFRGGVLEVEHGGEVATYRGSRKALSLVGFYNDCHHQIKPVTSGHRIVLTYNLMLRGNRPAETGPTGDSEGLTECLVSHFGGPDPPRRLVYLLDHDYTARGLSWSGLKGVDAGRVARLGPASRLAGCEAVLALADVRETWSAFEPERSWYGRPRHRRWDPEDEDDEEDGLSPDDSDDGYDLEEMVDSSVTIDSWLLAPAGKLEKIGLPVLDDELCASTPSGDLHPYASEYEGYTGNAGNTLDRWYHRGAVVIWPLTLSFPARAEASPSWALTDLATRIRRGDLQSVQADTPTLAPFWRRAVGRVDRPGLFTAALRTARLLDDPSSATMLLEPFHLEMLAARHAKALAAIVEAYGAGWAGDLFGSWSAQPRYFRPRLLGTQDWIASLGRLCSALVSCGDPGGVAALLLRTAWAWLAGAIEQARALPSPDRRTEALAGLGRPTAAVLSSASLVGATDLRDEIVRSLCQEDDDLLACATEVLRAVPAANRTDADVGRLADHCRRTLDDRLSRPSRAVDDWSVQPPPGCDCELCALLASFLADSARRVLEWPLAEKKRAHLHAQITRSDLPVRHETRRSGRPYTLVLSKTAALFEREAKARRDDEATLGWLRKAGLSPRPRSATRSPRA